MKLVKCKKCGATIMTSDTLLTDMQAEYDELVKKAHRAKGAKIDIIKQQLKHLNKMMVQICHSSTEAEIRKSNAYNELSALKKYLIHNQLISYEVLEKIQNDAREMTKQKIADDEKHIANIYGDFISELANRTMSDPTSKKAIENIAKERK